VSACATREHYEDLLAFLRNDSPGPCRVSFLRPINRIGNRIEAGQGRAVIESVAGDSVLGKEAARSSEAGAAVSSSCRIRTTRADGALRVFLVLLECCRTR
jgi:hypothetical protein